MKEPVKILEQASMEMELEKMKEVLVSAVGNFEEANTLFYQFLETDPAIGERYRIFSKSRKESAFALTGSIPISESVKRTAQESDLKESEQETEKEDTGKLKPEPKRNLS